MLRSLAQKSAAALLVAGLTFAALGVAVFSSPSVERLLPDRDRLIVHEWGTFLSVQGSDGVTLGGMVQSEDVLPPFVQERSLGGLSRASFFQKGETPVTYFYTDRVRTVQVRVDMPEGLLTHWFPAVRGFGPPPLLREQRDGSLLVDYNTRPPSVGSYLDWAQVELIPDAGPHGPTPALRPVAKDDHWRFARETDAAFVRVEPVNRGDRRVGEFEKFLFYRGLGTFALPLQARTASCCKSPLLTLTNRGPEPLQAVFAIQVTKDSLQFAQLPDLAAGAVHEFRPAAEEFAKLPLQEGVVQVKQAVAATLVQAGLYAKEAQAMVNTWEKSYFQNEGLRVLYIVPRRIVDQVFPIQVKPNPDELVRVMVGRVEVLTPDVESSVVKAVADLTTNDPQARKAGKTTLTRLGRLQEPVLHRVLALTQDADIRARAEALIKQFDTPRSLERRVW